jgi:hypothetical protein
MPNEFLVFMDHLQALEFADRPDYTMLNSLLTVRIYNNQYIRVLRLILSIKIKISFFGTKSN